MTRPPQPPPSYINHFGVCLDESWSMKRHKQVLIQVMDSYAAFLAQASREQDQETRLTVYTFSSRGRERCLFYDKDVLRLPSIAGLYEPDENTALVDCALLSIRELKQTATLHGLHSFMVTMLSDGIENDSLALPQHLAREIESLPDNWTTAAYGPDATAVHKLKQCGFPAGNISVWDTISSHGAEKVGAMMRETSEAFMKGRRDGVHGYNRRPGGLFRMREFTAAEVGEKLKVLAPGSYYFLDVPQDSAIGEFFEAQTKRSYEAGSCYYQFMKPEKVQPNKNLAVEQDGHVFTGPQARELLELPDYEVRVRPDQKAGCTIFFQSTSHNRKLIGGTRLLVIR